MPIPLKILSRKDEITADFIKIYEAHLSELFAGKVNYRMSSSKFAEKLFIHPGHLTNTIKLTTGKSPCDWMEHGILDEAQRLLRETHLPIAEIAMVFAYDEPTNFIKFFKGMCGMTPLQYRKSVQSQSQ
ncbi:helix-turn-helix domain-containing protein [Flavobacterium pallidum]|uniref:AraC family transcriptional regulator n=1 Tax=Flavobacterium pallidum TaxID=2172098 RepID=A0A2S1SHZ3_9FLAO|nr:AraC family transcriptional regulator [Flavobacterium pallidum]AWI26001.1 AraC family transcriptional regulator [Flavobacterium pallidum]